MNRQNRDARNGADRKAVEGGPLEKTGRRRRWPRHQTSIAGAATLVLLSAFAMASPAAAGSWGWGTSFRIGGLQIRIGHQSQHAGYYDDYYYEVDSPIRSNYRCTDRCYVQRNRHYHDRNCPVVRGYLGYHGYDTVNVFDRYAPHYRSGRAPYRYDRNDHYGRYSPRDRVYHERQRARDIERQRRWQRDRRERFERERRRSYRRERDYRGHRDPRRQRGPRDRRYP